MLKLFVSVSILGLILGGAVLAEEPAADVVQIVEQDENIQAQDLNVGDPSVLPGNPLYFFKNLARGIQSAVTFNPVAKAELKLKFSNEKIIEAKKLSEKNQKAEILTKALENYNQEVGALKLAAEKIKENSDNPKVDKFLDKLIDNNIKQQKLLSKFEKILPKEVSEKLKEVKDSNLEKFSALAEKLVQNPTVLEEKLTKITEGQAGSQFKNFKNLEVLKALEEKVPERAKDAIRKAQENALKRLSSDLNAMSPEKQEKFKDYLQNIGGDKLKHVEILEKLKNEAPEILKEKLEKATESTVKKIENLAPEKAASQIKKAEEIIAKVSSLVTNETPQAATALIQTAKKHLENAKLALDQKKYGEAFGQATAALNNAENALKAINKGSSEKRPSSDNRKVCAQVITPALSPEGTCKNFPTPCDVPEGWKKTAACESTNIIPKP